MSPEPSVSTESKITFSSALLILRSSGTTRERNSSMSNRWSPLMSASKKADAASRVRQKARPIESLVRSTGFCAPLRRRCRVSPATRCCLMLRDPRRSLTLRDRSVTMRSCSEFNFVGLICGSFGLGGEFDGVVLWRGDTRTGEPAVFRRTGRLVLLGMARVSDSFCSASSISFSARRRTVPPAVRVPLLGIDAAHDDSVQCVLARMDRAHEEVCAADAALMSVGVIGTAV